ncbi:GNAT family N-acetyltransferase [Streptomyces sp. NPDC018031]|uniref:GNAT family N-acetyltransferase n=1 Tax=Streptomyces sp. NPDC018031 TaxID=3365033 RepID=UPI00379CE33D
MTLMVSDAPKAQRFEARVDGVLAGFARYIRTPELIAFVHTEVEPAFEGQGIGSALARSALDDARAHRLEVLAVCPFISGWMARHPDYLSLAYKNRSRVTD